MDIAFVNRSRFLDDCEQAIRSNREPLGRGEPVRITFDEGGYSGQVTVTIREDDFGYFGSDWEGSDPTRFPARIKAAATALFNCGCRGRFVITHDDGAMAMQRA